MNYDELTVEAQVVLGELYKVYQQRVKNGEPRSQARRFSTFPEIHKAYFKDWTNEEDLLDIFKELGKKKFISSEWGNNTIISTQLSTEAISILQNRLGIKIKQIVNGLAKLKSLL